ncbi:hypothetical protein [Bacillus pumilus]|uniref:hypothetical protein n=1 Tax=Bacillus pumilus TaxID=1408 RepID=UPI003D702AC5
MANTTENNEMVVSSNELAEVEQHDVAQAPATIFEQTSQQIFSTIVAEDRKTKIKLYNAVNNSTASLSDHIGEVLEITDLVAHPIKVQQQDGSLVDALRTVLVAKDGTTYHSVANGVVDSLQKIIALVGAGSWADDPLKIVPKNVKTRNGFTTLTLALAE